MNSIPSDPGSDHAVQQSTDASKSSVVDLLTDSVVQKKHEIADLKVALMQLEHLPNELLALILSNIDLHELILLRVVNSRWKAVVESIFHAKRCLILFDVPDYRCIECLWLKPSDFISYQLAKPPTVSGQPRYVSRRGRLSVHFCHLLLEMFPNLEALAICWNSNDRFVNLKSLFILLDGWRTKLTTLVLFIKMRKTSKSAARISARINAMTNLTQLALGGSIKGWVNPNRLMPTLGRLRRLSTSIYSAKAQSVIFTNLGPQCTHLGIRCVPFVKDNEDSPIAEWLADDTGRTLLSKQLTHLWLGNVQGPHALVLLAQHAASLRVLQVDCISFCTPIPLETFAALARMPKLEELRFDWFKLDLAAFDGEHERLLVPSPTVRVLTLSHMYLGFAQVLGANFCRILSKMFPNLTELYILDCYAPEEMEPHLVRFTNLRKHEIRFDNLGMFITPLFD